MCFLNFLALLMSIDRKESLRRLSKVNNINICELLHLIMYNSINYSNRLTYFIQCIRKPSFGIVSVYQRGEDMGIFMCNYHCLVFNRVLAFRAPVYKYVVVINTGLPVNLVSCKHNVFMIGCFTKTPSFFLLGFLLVNFHESN